MNKQPLNRRQFLNRSALAGGALGLSLSAQAQDAATGPFKLPALPYDPDALSPLIDETTMLIHHGKHHAGYTNNLNATLEKVPSMKDASIEELMAKLSTVEDKASQTALRNNGGGFLNHCLFWETMAPVGQTGQPSDALMAAIKKFFGSLDGLQEAITKAGATQFGSGWAWLAVRDGQLFVSSTPNQDNPLMKGLVAEIHLGTPILGVDVWEHAYYLNYQNKRGDYLTAWWKLVNWNKVSELFAAATKK